MQTLTHQQGLDWTHFLAAMVLVAIRLSGLMVFAPVFSSDAIPARVKTLFVLTSAFLLAPVVSALPLAHVELGMSAVIGELSVGFIFGFGGRRVEEQIFREAPFFGGDGGEAFETLGVDDC